MSSSLETGVGHDKKPATANSFDVDSSPPAGKTTSLSMAANLLGGTQIVLFFLFGLCAKISFDASFQKTHGTVTEGYNMFIGVEIMMFIGFGYLMTFLKKYGIGAVGFTMCVTALGLQWALFTEHFWDQIYNNGEGWENVSVNIYSLMGSLFAISSVLISFGVCIGKINPASLVLMTLIEIFCHSFNYKVLLSGWLKITDVGGTYVDHMFGAYFGLAVSYVLGKPADGASADGGSVPDVFSMIGTLFLWVYWPSFVSGAMEADSDGQARAITATILALSSSTVTAFAASLYLSGTAKFRPCDIQNATLAGGVAIGCIANYTLQPFDVVLVGSLAGLISTIGFNFIQDYLLKNLGIHDTCGVHNLHALPSVLGAVASVILAAAKYEEGNQQDIELFDGTSGYASGQWGLQLSGIFVCIAFSLVTGLVTGHILKFTCATDDRYAFKDSAWWELASNHGSVHG